MNAKKTSAIAVCVTAILVFSPIAPIHSTGPGSSGAGGVLPMSEE